MVMLLKENGHVIKSQMDGVGDTIKNCIDYTVIAAACMANVFVRLN